MKTILLAMTSLSALAAAAPAAAQYRAPAPVSAYQGNFAARIARLETRLEAGVRAGTIARGEAWPLRQQLRELSRLERRFAYDGLSPRERDDLELRAGILRDRIRAADGLAYGAFGRVDTRYDRNRDGNDDRFDRDGDGDDDRYDRNDDGRDDRYDSNADGNDDRYDRNGDNIDDRFDRNADGIDDRYDRNADGNDDRYDRDGDDIDDRFDRHIDGYDDADPRTPLNDLDLDRDPEIGARLSIGAPAPADLFAVPAEYRHQYRDGVGTHYRSDGSAVYEIDARTNTIVRIYPLPR